MGGFKEGAMLADPIRPLEISYRPDALFSSLELTNSEIIDELKDFW